MEKQQLKKYNGYAIAGFIFSFFTIILSLILCIIGLRKYNETNSGKGLAIIGIVIVTLKIIIVAIIASFFSSLIWPKIKNNMETSANNVNNAIYCTHAFDCSQPDEEGYSICKYYDEENNISKIKCNIN